jgi:hypothetical protein
VLQAFGAKLGMVIEEALRRSGAGVAVAAAGAGGD